MNDTEKSKQWMAHAIRLARKGLATCAPNPPVGAIVLKDGLIVGEGFHQKSGEAHAEVHAIQAAGMECRGASLYVTLEPCSTQGRTGACTDAIIQSGIKNVFYGSHDPTETNGHRAKDLLESAGLTVVCGVAQEECDALLKPFVTYIKEKRPHVVMKVATSLDGRIACESGDSRWITSDLTRAWVHQLRHACQAIIIGEGTFLKDQPRLTVRIEEQLVAVPIRVVLCSKGAHIKMAPLFETNPATVYLVGSGIQVEAAVKDLGVQIIDTKDLTDPQAILETVLQYLYAEGVMQVLIEGGSRLYQHVLNAGLCDRLYTCIAPIIIGKGPLFIDGLANVADTIADSLRLEHVSIERFENDVVIGGDLPKCLQD